MVATILYLTFFLSLLYFSFQFVSLGKNLKFQDGKGNREKSQKLKPLPRLSLIKIVVQAVLSMGGVDFKLVLSLVRQANKILVLHCWKASHVIINDIQLAKELYKNPIFCGKDTTDMVKFLSQGAYGLINSDGKRWKKNRQFVHQHLKEFGFGKKSMESHIQTEVSDLIEDWASKKGQVFSPNKSFYLPVLNAIWVILTGDRASTLDKELIELVYKVYEGFRQLGTFPNFIFVVVKLPLKHLRRILSWIPIFSGAKAYTKNVTELRSYLRNTIAAKKQTLELNSESTNLVQVYLNEMAKATDPDSEFFGETGELNLLATMTEFFIAGGDTTSNMLAWTMFHLIRNSEMQARIQEETDSVIGTHRWPSLQDRPNCPYTEAFLLEVLRSNPVTPVGLVHSTTEDTSVGEYFIKKGTILTLNIYGMQHDPAIWGEPDKFRPERFLSQDGKTVVKQDALCIFSQGLRRCVGETMARDTLFLFTSAICQRFVLKPDPSLNGALPQVGISQSLLLVPNTFGMVAIDRLCF